MTAAPRVRRFLLPDLGEGLTEAEIVTWLVATGDTITVDQPVAEVETAKATVEVPCPYAGTVTELHGEPGATVAVGAPLVSVDVGSDAPSAGPDVGSDGTAGDGRSAPSGSGGGSPTSGNGAGPGTRAATPAPGALDEPGVVVPAARDAAENGSGGNGATADEPGSGAVLVGYGTGEGRRGRRRRARAAEGPRTTASAAPSPSPTARTGRTPVVSPLVRRMAREHGVDVARLTGSGEGGLVLRRDVAAAIATPSGPSPEATGGPAPGTTIGASGAAEETRVPLRGTRRAMAELVTRSRREIPEATVWVDADATGLLDLRETLNRADPDRPVSVLALLAKFCLLGLRRFPALNARVDTERSELVRLAGVNLGFAAQTPRGLLVPVVRDAHAMTTRQLAAELSSATEAARSGALEPSRLTGGTFTVNNYGVFGVDGSAAVINHPEAAIVGMGRIVRRPWVVDDELTVRPVTELTLAFDHRVCDGAEAGGFLRFVADCVERPATLLGDV